MLKGCVSFSTYKTVTTVAQRLSPAKRAIEYANLKRVVELAYDAQYIRDARPY